MELKCTNPNGDIILVSKLNHEKKKKTKKMQKSHSEMNPIGYFFHKDALIAQKTRMSITFS